MIQLDVDKIKSSRNDGRVTKADVLDYVNIDKDREQSLNTMQEVVPMSKIRLTIANRLKEAQNTAAILTTFNEVDMSEIIKVREAKKENFIKRNKVKLGFMSFFVKASVQALKEYSAAANLYPENPELPFWTAVTLAQTGELGKALPIFKDVFSKNKSLRELIPRIVESGFLKDDQKIVQQILNQ